MTAVRRLRWRALARRAARSACRNAEFYLQALLDFLIEDLCVICRRGHRGTQPAPAGIAACLDRPVRVRWLAPLTIENHPFCRACLDAFDPARGPGRLDVGSEEDTGEGVRSIRITSPFMTNDGVLAAVHSLKFGRYVELAPLMAAAIAACVDRRAPASLLVPAPMDRRDRRKRGFNQAEILARELGWALRAPVEVEALFKVRRTAAQARTAREHRVANVRGAFSSRPRRVAGRHIVLVDDLVTSGATAVACARALFDAGARSVEVLSFGRAV